MRKPLVIFLTLTLAFTEVWAQINNGGGGGSATFQTGVNKPGNPTANIWAGAYGVVTDYAVSDATTTATNSVVTCPDCNFNTTAAVGNVVQGNASCTSQGGASTPVPVGTISSVDSNTQIHVSTTTVAQAGTVCLAWGPDNSSALDTAYAAAVAACADLQLGSGIFFTKQPQFNYGGSNPLCTGANGLYRMPTVVGAGWGPTLIVPTQDFNFGAGHGCGTYPSSGCFFGVQFQAAFYLTISGLGSSGQNYGGSTARALVLNNGGDFVGVVEEYWCIGSCPGSYGHMMTGTQATSSEGGTQTFGESACGVDAVTSGTMKIWPCTGTQQGLRVFGNSDVVTTGGIYRSNNACCSEVLVDAGSVWTSIHESDLSGNGNINISGIADIDDFHFATGSTNPPAVLSGGILTARNTTFVSQGGNYLLLNNGSAFFDQRQNTFPAAAISGTCGSACVFRTGSISGARCVAGNFAFTSGWGTSAITGTPTGDAQRCSFAIQTTVTGTAGPVLTYTFPSAFTNLRVPVCTLMQVGGTFTLSNPAHVITGTTDTITFAGTPTQIQTYNFVEDCK